MPNESLTEYLLSKGYVHEGKRLMGYYYQYPLTVTVNVTRKKESANVIMSLAAAPSKAVMKAAKKEIGIKLYVYNAQSTRKDLISLGVSSLDGDIVGAWENTLSKVTSYLKANGLEAPDTCQICQHGSTDAYGFYQGAYSAIHRNCLEAKCEEAAYDVVDRQEHGSYLRGFIGALLGAFVGAIPTFITIMAFDRIQAYLCALIPLASFFGYRLLKGKPTKLATLMVLLCSVLQIFVLEQALFYAVFWVQYMEMWPTIWDSVSFYFDYYTFADFLSNTATIIVFVLLGIVFSFGAISQTGKKELNQMMDVLKTIRDKT